QQHSSQGIPWNVFENGKRNSIMHPRVEYGRDRRMKEIRPQPCFFREAFAGLLIEKLLATGVDYRKHNFDSHKPVQTLVMPQINNPHPSASQFTAETVALLQESSGRKNAKGVGSEER